MSAPKTAGEALDQGYEWIELYWKDGPATRGTLSTNLGAFPGATELLAALEEMRRRLTSGDMVGGGVRKSTSKRYDPDETSWTVVFGRNEPPLQLPKKRGRARQKA